MFKDKEKFIHLCLHELKHGSLGDVRQWIQMAKDCGYDYPEFKPIEKSLGDLKEGNNDGVAVYTTYDVNQPDAKHVVRFREHEAFVKLCLKELRTGIGSEVKYWIKMCRNAGYDYPEFKTIEKSIGKIAEAFDAEGETAENYYSDKTKVMKNVLTKIKHEHPFYKDRVAGIIQRSRKAGYDYPEFKAIEKSLKEAVIDGLDVWDDALDKRITIKFTDKDKLLKYLVGIVKKHHVDNEHHNSTQFINSLLNRYIKKSRAAGYDYPEFKAIEKSISEVNEAFDPIDPKEGVRVWDDDVPSIIKYSDKKKFVTFVLNVLKNGGIDHQEIRNWIKGSRDAGYDYPELKAIEKSIGK